jgi:hypothetical protein
MKELTNFSAIYCSGLLIPNQATVASLSLLFDKIYLPNNIEYAIDFAKHYRINGKSDRYKNIVIKPFEEDETDDPFKELTEKEKETAFKYIDWSMGFAKSNHELFDNVFESNIFVDGNPLKVDLVKKGVNGALNTYRVSESPMQLTGEDKDTIPKLIKDGYVPVVGNIHGKEVLDKFDPQTATAKQLAAILGMQAIEMFFPATKAVPAGVILEARSKLSDHLPVFWSSMLKLSKELKPLLKECKTPSDVIHEGRELVDTLVRPAIIDLNDKIEKERKQWFYRIFGRAYKGLKILAGTPPITQEQLIRNSLLLGADAAMGIANDLQKVEAMKSEVGLTYLLELGTLTKNT